MRTYQSEHDRVITELSNAALPFQTEEGVIKITAEVKPWGGVTYIIL